MLQADTTKPGASKKKKKKNILTISLLTILGGRDRVKPDPFHGCVTRQVYKLRYLSYLILLPGLAPYIGGQIE